MSGTSTSKLSGSVPAGSNGTAARAVAGGDGGGSHRVSEGTEGSACRAATATVQSWGAAAQNRGSLPCPAHPRILGG